MEGGCQDPVYNTWHILHMRSVVMKELARREGELQESYRHYLREKKQQRLVYANSPLLLPPHDNNNNKKKKRKGYLVVLRRSSNSKFTRNNSDLVRQWNDRFTRLLLQELQSRLGHLYHILLLSDQDEFFMNCFLCQAWIASKANILIGVHGAGLGLMLYMSPNSAVIEIAPYGNDGRCLLGGGPFSRLATVMAHNYLIHYPR